jgi:hypothetical protein
MLQFSGLKQPLPSNVHLLSLEQWSDNMTTLIRLEHPFQNGEDQTLSTPVTVNLQVIIFYRLEQRDYSDIWAK